MILTVAILFVALGQSSLYEKIYSHPPADFNFLCTVDACPVDMGKAWVGIDENNGKFMECHREMGVHDSSNCYDIPHQKRPTGCKPRRGHTWFRDCVAGDKKRPSRNPN